MIESIQDLRIFLQILESGSMSAAARAQRVSTAYVSKRLRLLEESLSTRLFQRTTRALTVTQEGEKLAVHARRVLAEVEEAERVMTGSKTLNGNLHVSAPASFGRKYVVPIVFDFMRAHPDLNVHLSLSDQRLNMLEQDVDVAIRIYQPLKASEVVRKLADNSRKLVASPVYLQAHGVPMHPDELDDHDCLTFPNENEWRFEKGEQQIGIRPRGRFTTSTGDGLTAAALAGLGIALKSTWDIHKHLASGALVEVLPQWLFSDPLGIYAVYPQSQNTPLRVRLFIDAVVESWAAGPPWIVP